MKFNRLLSFLFAGLFLAPIAHAQPGKFWPHDRTAAETEAWPSFLLNAAKNEGAPPPSPVRTMAEWEEVQGLVITWTQYTDILTEIVRYAVDECTVFIVTNDPVSVETHLLQQGILLDNVEFLPTAFNSVWIRDYGPWAVYHGMVDSLSISDYIYNRPSRPDDDVIPSYLADFLALPYYAATAEPYRWIHSGGNFLRDGLGNGWSSDLVLLENSGKSGREIAEYAELFFGIKDYRFLQRLPYDVIHHLDMHIRTLDEETLAVGLYPEGVADGPQIEANLAYLRNHFRTPFGNPYRIIRQTMPPDNGSYPNTGGDYRTYTNGIFINNTFLVPIYEEQYDTTALRIYEEYLPGYRVVGIDCNDMIGANGAIHCITKLIGVEDPLLIVHPRLRDTYADGEDIPVEAFLYHPSGIASAALHYRVAPATAYTSAPMSPGAEADQWTAAIPPQPAGAEVQYYLEATANNGKVLTRPMPAPEGYYPFKVEAFAAEPTPDWVQSSTYGPAGMQVQFLDDSQGGATAWSWTFAGGEPATATGAEAWVTYPEPGTYPVSLTISNPNGEGTLTREGAITITEAVAPFTEDFAAGLDPLRWQIDNPDGDNYTWEEFDDTSCHGSCLRINNRNSSSEFRRDYLETTVDLSGYDQVGLSFDIAHAPRNSSRWDELRINITDETGRITNVFNQGGQVLATRNNTFSTFVPAGCGEWRTESVDLSDWAGQRILVSFENISDEGNNIYLDNISWSVNSAPLVSLTEPLDGSVLELPPNPLDIIIPVAANATDPDGPLAAVVFYVNDAPFDTLTSPPFETFYEADSLGNYCFTAQAIDEAGLAGWSATHCMTAELAVATQNPARLPAALQLSPNPARESALLRVTSEQALGDCRLQILDAQGRIIRQQTVKVPAGTLHLPLDLQGLPAGNYAVKLGRAEQFVGGRLIKLR